MRLRLRTLIPLYIGGREGALNPLEFVVFESRCYVISETKLARALQERDQIDTFYTWFTDRARPALREFLQECGLLNAVFLERIAAYASPCSSRVSQALRTFVRDAFNRPFLPGTSIKGAIRTALLYMGLLKLTSLVSAMLSPLTASLLSVLLLTERGTSGHVKAGQSRGDSI